MVSWWAPMLLKREGQAGMRGYTQETKRGLITGAFRSTVLVRPRRESYAGPGKPRYLPHKDDEIAGKLKVRQRQWRKPLGEAIARSAGTKVSTPCFRPCYDTTVDLTGTAAKAVSRARCG